MARRKVSFEEKIDTLRRNIKEQPKSNFVIAFVIFATLFYIVIIKPQDKGAFKKTGEEIKLARMICQTSLEWVLENDDRLKLGKSSLEDFKPDGKHKANFKYISVPRILFYDTGYRGAADSSDLGQRRLYCTYTDPRDGMKYYYAYHLGKWVDKITLIR